MNEKEFEPLKEIVTIGAGNSATALSKVLYQEVKVNVPDLKLVKVENVQEIIGKKDDLVTVILVQLNKDIQGAILYIFDPEVAKKLANIMTTDPNMTDSALKEMVNIMLGNGLKAEADFLQLNILHTVPAIATDMLGAVVDPLIVNLGEKSQQVLMLSVEYGVGDMSFSSFFLADPKSTNLVLEKIEQKVANNGSNN